MVHPDVWGPAHPGYWVIIDAPREKYERYDDETWFRISPYIRVLIQIKKTVQIPWQFEYII